MKSFQDYLRTHSNERIFVYGGSGNVVTNLCFGGSDIVMEYFDAYEVKGELGRRIRKFLGMKELDYLQ